MRLALVLILSMTAGWARAQSLRDYSLMTHRVFVDSLRAGNHDKSGVNEYYFVYKMQTIRNTKDDATKELDKRPTIHHDPKIFGELKIPVLSQWQPASKNSEDELYLDIDGNEIRSAVSAAMREFNAKESEISITAVIEMWERNRILGYFGEDTKIGEVRYFPIPASEYHAAARTNLKLNLEDDKGTLVNIKVKYENPRIPSQEMKKKNSERGAKPEPVPSGRSPSKPFK